jgi:hypothetical protein
VKAMQHDLFLKATPLTKRKAQETFFRARYGLLCKHRSVNSIILARKSWLFVSGSLGSDVIPWNLRNTFAGGRGPSA